MLVGHVLEAVLNGDLSALLPSALSSISDGAEDALKEKLNEFNSAKDVMKDLKDWAKNQFENWMPDADGLERVEKDINDLLLRTYKPGGRMSFPTSETPYRTRWTAARFRRKPTAAWVKPMTFFAPDGQVPMDMGTLPGMGTDAVGTSRSGDGGYGDSGDGYGGSGSSGSSQGGTTPLGGSGSSSGTSNAGSGDGTQPPTAGDLGK